MRPIPVYPRGPRRTVSPPAHQLLACPRVSPEWELNAFCALIKPQARGSILHRKSLQSWSPAAERIARTVADDIAHRLGFRSEIHFPPLGDYFMVASAKRAEIDSARAMAVVLSTRLPDTWFVIGRLFVLNGRFYRRARGYKLRLVEATNVHLPRAIRAAIAGA